MRRALAVLATTIVGACGMFVEPPTDEQMTARFQSDRAAFESLMGFIQKTPALANGGAWPLRPEGLNALDVESRRVLQIAFDRLGVKWIQAADNAGGLVFVTWATDIVGAGYRARGFAWATKHPPGQPRAEGRASYAEYKPLESNWYLFEELID